MTGIVLSASVRQNLLALQSTAALLATTQNDLATGNKVNTALDNPTNYFTAQALNNRASDINNLLDGIGNGVQVLQAANTGITSLSSLIASAQSIAQQSLQTTVGYSTLSNYYTTVTGATAADLRGTTTFSSATASSNVITSGGPGGSTAITSNTYVGGLSAQLVGNFETDITGTTITGSVTLLGIAASSTVLPLVAQPVDGETLTVNGHTITFKAGTAPAAASVASGYGVGSGSFSDLVTDGNGNTTVYLGTTTAAKATLSELGTAIDLASGVQQATISNGTFAAATTSGVISTITLGKLSLSTGTGSDLSIAGNADLLHELGLTNATGAGSTTVTQARTTTASTLNTLIQSGSTLNVDGHTITFKNAQVPVAASVATGSGVTGNIVTDGAGNSTVYLQGGALATPAKVSDILTAIDLASGVQIATNTAGAAALAPAPGIAPSSVSANGTLQISTGVNADLSITGTGNALAALGLTGPTNNGTNFTAARAGVVGGGINGKTLTFSSFNGGTAVNVTFGNGTGGTVQTLAQLNTALQADNLIATLDSTGKLTISSINEYASSSLGSTAGGAIGGSLYTGNPSAFTYVDRVPDPTAQTVRANLVAQYNNILAQINTTSQDSSFNGVNLLNGDNLKLTFNETSTSILNITGVNFNAAGLGLANLVTGTDFIDNNATNKVVASLASASTTLRSEASSLGSNLSIVQIRQDFSKNLINVLQTGASNLTIADTNAEAANSQALSTRQSIAVSALSLANQSQQSVLQLLR